MGADWREEGVPSELKSIHRGPRESNVRESDLTVSSLSLGAFLLQQGWTHRSPLLSGSSASEKWSEQESQKTAAASWWAE